MVFGIWIGKHGELQSANVNSLYKERENEVSGGHVGSWWGQVIGGNLYLEILEIPPEGDA